MGVVKKINFAHPDEFVVLHPLTNVKVLVGHWETMCRISARSPLSLQRGSMPKGEYGITGSLMFLETSSRPIFSHKRPDTLGA